MPLNILSKIDAWKKSLLDFSKRNRLINCRIGGRNTLEIVFPDLEKIFQRLAVDEKTLFFPWKTDLCRQKNDNKDDDEKLIPLNECLQSRLLGENDLLTQLSDKELNRKLKRKSADAKESLDEHGINVLYIGFGFLKWFESANSDEALYSPLYLVPVRLHQVSLGKAWEAERYDDEAMYNHSLWELLKQDFRLTLPNDPIAGISEAEDFDRFLDSVRQAIPSSSDYARWEVQRRVVLDCFNFQKLAMYQDMERNKEKIAEHVLCRIIAGDETAYDQLQNEPGIAAEDLDEKVHPLETFSVLDSDSSQQEAVQAVLRGINLVLDGPPGTGKSQTIANIIAEMLGEGKTVLFVSEKAAAIEVVKKRLDQAKLGDFCLDCHALFKKSAAGKRGIISELVRCLELSGEQYSDQTNELKELYELRNRLNDYAKALHKPLSKLNKTPFQVHGLYLQFMDEKPFRSPIPDPFDIEPERFAQIQECFGDLARNSATENPGQHPWRGCRLTNVAFERTRIQEDFLELAESIKRCDSAVNVLNENDLLPNGITIGPLFESLKKILPLFNVKSETGQPLVPEEWFNIPLKRFDDFLLRLKLFRNSQQNLIQCKSELTQFTSSAFRPEAKTIAEKKHRFAGFFQRFMGFFNGELKRWKSELTELYCDKIPSTGQILEDITDLLEYHRLKNDLEDNYRNLEKFKNDFADFIPESAAGTENDTEADFPDFDRQVETYRQFAAIFGKNITVKNRRILTSADRFNHLRQSIGIICDFYNHPNFKNLWARLTDCFPLNEPVSTGIVISKLPLKELNQWLRCRVNDIDLLDDWMKYKSSTDKLKKFGLDRLVDEIEERTLQPDKLKAAFFAQFYIGWLQKAYSKSPVLGNFSADTQFCSIEKFCNYDRKAFRESYKRLRQTLLNSRRFSSGNAPPTSDVGILTAESNKKRKLMSVRQLFSKIHNLILQLKPCVMMSPLTVSTYLQNVTEKFDLVIFDEASQIRPHDAVTVIYRGRQIVVAGDQKQLPPTTFFSKLGDENAEAENEDDVSQNLNDFESILDVFAAKLNRKRLRWHYRSRRESLIAFSNRNIYNNDLVTFPSADDEFNNPAVKFEYVENGRWKSGTSGGFNQIEAEKAAELVFQFFREYPDKSLGVITLNQRHQEAVIDELEKLRRNAPDMEHFFDNNDDDDKPEPFFVKNLENVQGDERDYIFLCIGYGKTDEGKMSMNFGPLNKQGGERRLNVAVTRAKQGITVVSSIQYHDIELQRTNSLGVKLLHDYLDFAEHGIRRLIGTVTDSAATEAESPFEYEVAKTLKDAGFDVHHQIGCSGYRIDLALMDTDSPGRYVLGIECDGATYHRSATARDRDRLRQEVLEGLGWTIHRIWSTDWIQNPQKQLEKVKAAFESAKTARKTKKNKPKIDDEKPKPVPKPSDPFAQKYHYANIDKVPRLLIRETILYVLNIQRMSEDDLFRTVAAIFGFQRVGPKIRNALTEQLKTLQKEKTVFFGNDERLFIDQ